MWTCMYKLNHGVWAYFSFQTANDLCAPQVWGLSFITWDESYWRHFIVFIKHEKAWDVVHATYSPRQRHLFPPLLGNSQLTASRWAPGQELLLSRGTFSRSLQLLLSGRLCPATGPWVWMSDLFPWLRTTLWPPQLQSSLCGELRSPMQWYYSSTAPSPNLLCELP